MPVLQRRPERLGPHLEFAITSLTRLLDPAACDQPLGVSNDKDEEVLRALAQARANERNGRFNHCEYVNLLVC